MSWSLPVKTKWMESQSSHQASMGYARDIYLVARKLQNFKALEVGAAWGFSTLAILEAGAKSLESIDPDIQIKAPGEVEANGYTNWSWNCVRSKIYWQENSAKFDLIFIDGSHLYEDVKNDLYQAWERLYPNGLLLIDDWDHKKNIVAEGTTSEYGVSLAAWEFFRDHQVSDIGIEGRILWFKK